MNKNFCPTKSNYMHCICIHVCLVKRKLDSVAQCSRQQIINEVAEAPHQAKLQRLCPPNGVDSHPPER